MKPIIKSLSDNDLYKFLMQQVIRDRYPNANAAYEFKCRNLPQVKWPADFLFKLNEQLDHLCSLSFSIPEINYFKDSGLFNEGYLSFLLNFRLIRSMIETKMIQDELVVRIDGTMIYGMMFEIYVLAIVNELYFEDSFPYATWREGSNRLNDNIDLIRNTVLSKGVFRKNTFELVEFGTRRRYSRDWQNQVIIMLKLGLGKNFLGTSNVYLAKEHDLNCIGTMAHEYLQAFQAFSQAGPRGLVGFQVEALEVWHDFYKDKVQVALSDIVGRKAFLRDFNPVLSNAYSGIRQDSGNPIQAGEDVITHYQSKGIDPLTKTIVFSDGLNVKTGLDLFLRFSDRIKTIIAIGTKLTNDVGFTPLEIVIKMVSCNGLPVAKISDSGGKGMCKDMEYLLKLRKMFDCFAAPERQ